MLVYVFALVMLFKSALPVVMSIVLGVGLLSMMLSIVRCRVPFPRYSKLAYHTRYWLLHTITDDTIKYEQATIRLDAGFFIFLTLHGISPKKNLLVFKDQMTAEQQRFLHLINKIN